MKLGVLSDVHGNRMALEAVVADGAAQGVDTWWALGDLIAVGPDPVPCLELLVDLPNVTITRGNSERYVFAGDRPSPFFEDVLADLDLLGLFVEVEASFSWTRGAVASHGWLDWIGELPLETRLTLDDGTRLLGVHASPGRDDGDGVSPQRPEDELRAALDGAEADIVLTGHTHRPTDRQVGSVRAVNGGSVSNPTTDDLRPGYVIVHADRHGHGVEHRRVAYDRDAFLARVERCGHPGADFIASFHRGERILYPSVHPGAPVLAEQS
jgi:predicted phosphodiesterase